MQRLASLLLASLVLYNAACARGNARSDGPQARDDAVQLAERMTGNWSLRTDPPTTQPGIRITVVIDSAGGARFWGRLTHFFSGDVGVDPLLYEPFEGAFEETGAVSFEIAATDGAAPPIGVEGMLAADTVHCSRVQLGPDTMTGGSRSWYLIRERG